MHHHQLIHVSELANTREVRRVIVLQTKAETQKWKNTEISGLCGRRRAAWRRFHRFLEQIAYQIDCISENNKNDRRRSSCSCHIGDE